MQEIKEEIGPDHPEIRGERTGGGKGRGVLGERRISLLTRMSERGWETGRASLVKEERGWISGQDLEGGRGARERPEMFGRGWETGMERGELWSVSERGWESKLWTGRGWKLADQMSSPGMLSCGQCQREAGRASYGQGEAGSWQTRCQ